MPCFVGGRGLKWKFVAPTVRFNLIPLEGGRGHNNHCVWGRGKYDLVCVLERDGDRIDSRCWISRQQGRHGKGFIAVHNIITPSIPLPSTLFPSHFQRVLVAFNSLRMDSLSPQFYGWFWLLQMQFEVDPPRHPAVPLDFQGHPIDLSWFGDCRSKLRSIEQCFKWIYNWNYIKSISTYSYKKR